jgi:N-hydroxyarylamine O-acetyltransferase
VLDPALTDRLLDHIGLTERPAPDASGLRTVHRAFLSRISYAGLTPQLGEHAPLDADALVTRLLPGGRGGYCFEMNTMLLELLTALGFAVERREAVVKPRGARAAGALTDHMALVVDVAGEQFIADAGWGEAPLDPIPLRDGPFTVGPFTWTVEREPDGGWWLEQHEWGETPGFWFAGSASTAEDFAPHHLRIATSPESGFVKTLVVQRPYDERVVTLRSRTLAVDGPGLRERTVIADAGAFAAVLRDTFAIDPDALGPQRMERLWAQACAQHEAFVAARAAAQG